MLILLRAVAVLLAAITLPLTALPRAAAENTLPSSAASTDRMDDFVRSRKAAIDVPGVAYAIVGPQGITHTGTFGEDGDGHPITADTPFLWGSVAKPVTATLIMQLVAAGTLRLDEPVVTYLPRFRFRDKDASDRITLRQLLAQTSGIPGSFDLTDHFESDRVPADVLGALTKRKLAAAPGAEHIYSSVNYLLLGAVVEAVTGRSFVDVLTERVLEPAGMRDTITTQRQAEQLLPRGHRFVFGQPMPFAAPYDPAGVSSGYLGGTLTAAAAFARANLPGSTALLDDAQREVMFQGEISTGTQRTYGLGWRKWQVRGTEAPMVWHSGVAPGYFASMILLPEQQHAIVVLQNAHGRFQENQLLSVGFGLAEMLYGEQPRTAAVDSIYWPMLIGLTVLAVALLALGALSGYRLIRPRDRKNCRPWRIALDLTLRIVPLLAILYGFAIALPRYYEVQLGQIMLWAPDLAILAYLVIGFTGLLLLLQIAVGIRQHISR